MDTLLQPFLESASPVEEQERLNELMENRARPLILRVIRSRMRGQQTEIEDVCTEAQMELLLWLRRVKAGASSGAIEDFAAYTATIALNACSRYFRRGRPAQQEGAIHLSNEHWQDLADGATGTDQAIDHRRFIARLWSEIAGLPPEQRAALLLHMRDGRGCAALPLFPICGAAFLPAIAEALRIPEAELAALWPELPLDDNRIAGVLGCSRQRVINLRMSARKRLANRMRKES